MPLEQYALDYPHEHIQNFILLSSILSADTNNPVVQISGENARKSIG
jgi:hypothetical protein